MGFKVESLEQLIERYGDVYCWDSYVRFINKWRLACENMEIRVLVDVALQCPDEKMRTMAREKFGKDFDIVALDSMWPGRGDFVYPWTEQATQEPP